MPKRKHTESQQIPVTIANNEGLWSPRTAADYCELQSVTILRAIRRGELRAYKLSARLIRLNPEDVRAWLARGRIGEREAA